MARVHQQHLNGTRYGGGGIQFFEYPPSEVTLHPDAVHAITFLPGKHDTDRYTYCALWHDTGTGAGSDNRVRVVAVPREVSGKTIIGVLGGQMVTSAEIARLGGRVLLDRITSLAEMADTREIWALVEADRKTHGRREIELEH
jgi:hypothetical protein